MGALAVRESADCGRECCGEGGELIFDFQSAVPAPGVIPPIVRTGGSIPSKAFAIVKHECPHGCGRQFARYNPYPWSYHGNRCSRKNSVSPYPRRAAWQTLPVCTKPLLAGTLTAAKARSIAPGLLAGTLTTKHRGQDAGDRGGVGGSGRRGGGESPAPPPPPRGGGRGGGGGAGSGRRGSWGGSESQILQWPWTKFRRKYQRRRGQTPSGYD